MSTGVTLAAEPRVIKDKHLKLRLQQGGEIRDAIWFGSAERELPRPPWDIAFNIDRNEWRGNVSVSMMIQDVRAAQPQEAANKTAGNRRNVADPASATAVGGR